VLERRCAEDRVEEAEITTHCRSATGENLPDTVYHRHCDTGTTNVERGAP
jgi:hypothetical protein